MSLVSLLFGLKMALDADLFVFSTALVSRHPVYDLMRDCLKNIAYISSPSYTDYVATDRETREYALSVLPQLIK